MGIAIAVMGPLLSAMIKQYFPDKAASVIGVYSFGMGVGSAASAGLTAVFFDTTGSYLFALSIWSVLAFVGLAAWVLAMKDLVKVHQLDPVAVKVKRQQMKSPWKTPKAWVVLYVVIAFMRTLKIVRNACL